MYIFSKFILIYTIKKKTPTLGTRHSWEKKVVGPSNLFFNLSRTYVNMYKALSYLIKKRLVYKLIFLYHSIAQLHLVLYFLYYCCSFVFQFDQLILDKIVHQKFFHFAVVFVPKHLLFSYVLGIHLFFLIF